MKRSWLLSLILAVALASLNMPAFADDSSSDSMEDLNAAIGSLTNKVNTLEKKGPAVEIHGFAETDVINDSTQSFVETVGNGAVSKNGSVAGDNGWTQFSLRNSRIQLLGQAEVDGWKTKGLVEADFIGYDQGPGYGSEYASNGLGYEALTAAPADNSEYKFYTQPTLRLRHAYLDAQKDGWDILVGQYWTLLGWNSEYVLSTVTEQPVMGPIYERIPQVRVGKTIDVDKDFHVQLAVAAEKPDEIASQVPNLLGGVRFVLDDLKGRFCAATGAQKLQPLSLGFSVRNSEIAWENDSISKYSLDETMWGTAVAVDLLVPVLPAAEGKDDPSVVITAECTDGAGDTDAFNGGGFSGLNSLALANGSANLDGGIAGYGTAGDLQLVQLQTLTAQIQISLPPSIGTIVTAGYGEIYSPNDGGLGVVKQGAVTTGTATTALTTATYNDDACLFVNVMQDFTPAVRVGLEYAWFDTHYVAAFDAMGNHDAIDNRVQLSSWYRF